MRFIKRLIFIIILLLIAFFIYRLISPQSAKQFLYDLKLSSNTTIGTQFLLTGEILDSSGLSLDVAEVVVENTWILQDISDDEQLLLNDFEFLQEDIATGIYTTGIVSTWVISVDSSAVAPLPQLVPPVISLQSKIPTHTSSTLLSAQEKRDLNRFLQNFEN